MRVISKKYQTRLKLELNITVKSVFILLFVEIYYRLVKPNGI